MARHRRHECFQQDTLHLGQSARWGDGGGDAAGGGKSLVGVRAGEQHLVACGQRHDHDRRMQAAAQIPTAFGRIGSCICAR